MKKNNLRKKVLFLVQLPPPVHGASKRNLSVVESKLINKNFNLKVLPLSFSKNIKQLGKASFRKFFLFIGFIYKLVSLLIKNNFSFVYFTISVRPLGILRDSIIIFLLKIFDLKLLFHLRNKGVKVYSKNFFLRMIYSWVFDSNNVICLSKSISKDIEDFIKEDQLYIVNNGIDISPINAKIKSKNKTLNLIYLSHLRKSKGVMEFLNSVKILIHSGYDITASIVGDEGDISFNYLKKFCKDNSIENKVNILGPLYGNDKFKILNDSDIFIFPSYYYNEIFPGVILEAMQMRLPIITTSEGAIADIIKNNYNGLIVEKKDVKSLVYSIKKLIDQPDIRNKLALQAYKDFYKYYTIDVFEKNMLNTFNKIAKNS